MMDKEGVPSSSGLDIIDGETESDEYECGNLVPRAFPLLSLGRREKALAPGGHMTFNTQI
jgi:hypothetical protein